LAWPELDVARGRFISLEGGEGVGKSTQLEALARALEGRGLRVVVTREPGGSPGAEAVRKLLLEGDETRWNPRAEALLFAAARSDHIEKTIRPALDRGEWVLSDRFLDSSLAYQGEAGGLGIGAVRDLHRFGSLDFLPDRTLVLILDETEGAARARSRDGNPGDRIGSRPPSYHAAVEAGFRTIAANEPDRVKLVDAEGSAATVTARLLYALGDLIQ
jgi:dTMP kinase